jgi:hypothetical protein
MPSGCRPSSARLPDVLQRGRRSGAGSHPGEPGRRHHQSQDRPRRQKGAQGRPGGIGRQVGPGVAGDGGAGDAGEQEDCDHASRDEPPFRFAAIEERGRQDPDERSHGEPQAAPAQGRRPRRERQGDEQRLRQKPWIPERSPRRGRWHDRHPAEHQIKTGAEELREAGDGGEAGAGDRGPQEEERVASVAHRERDGGGHDDEGDERQEPRDRQPLRGGSGDGESRRSQRHPQGGADRQDGAQRSGRSAAARRCDDQAHQEGQGSRREQRLLRQLERVGQPGRMDHRHEQQQQGEDEPRRSGGGGRLR